jgi:serine/threonine protein phosphatase PrpC
MLHYDHYYTIGVTHQVCEDFAMQGDKPVPFLVLSDGCSGSENTEIGSRILTMTTKHLLENATDWPWNYSIFGQQLINKAWEVAEQMQLPSSVLDATVMLAFLYQESILVYVYGDGCLLFKDYSGNIHTIEISFTHNAPYYLTYWNDEERREEYAKQEPNPLVLTNSINGLSEAKPFQTPLSFCFSLKKFKMVAIASDGMTQCIDTSQKSKLSLNEVANHFLAVQEINDEFVKHHLKSTLKQYAQQGIYPADDLSIGVFAEE